MLPLAVCVFVAAVAVDTAPPPTARRPTPLLAAPSTETPQQTTTTTTTKWTRPQPSAQEQREALAQTTATLLAAGAIVGGVVGFVFAFDAGDDDGSIIGAAPFLFALSLASGNPIAWLLAPVTGLLLAGLAVGELSVRLSDPKEIADAFTEHFDWIVTGVAVGAVVGLATATLSIAAE